MRMITAGSTSDGILLPIALGRSLGDVDIMLLVDRSENERERTEGWLPNNSRIEGLIEGITNHYIICYIHRPLGSLFYGY